MFFYFIFPVPKKTYNKTLMWQATIHWLVDYDFINQNYSFTGIVCKDNITKCLDDNDIVFFDNNWKIKKKTVYYFLSTGLNFYLTGDWYKKRKNIEELYNKTRFIIWLPEYVPLKFSRYFYIKFNSNFHFSEIIQTPFFRKP